MEQINQLDDVRETFLSKGDLKYSGPSKLQMNSLVSYGSGSSSGSDSEDEKTTTNVKSSSRQSSLEAKPNDEGKVTIEDNLHLKPVGGPSGSGMVDFSKKMEVSEINAFSM